MTVTDTQLSLRAEHAKGFDTTKFRFLEFPVIECGADQGKWNLDACARIRRTTDNLVCFVTAADFTHNQFICIGMGADLKNIADDNTRELCRHRRDPFHLQASHGELFRQFFGGQVWIDELSKPVLTEFHLYSCSGQG